MAAKNRNLPKRKRILSTLYLLCFDKPYWKVGKAGVKGVGAGVSEARHYVGYTIRPLDQRVDEHRQGQGSRLVKYALDHGNDFRVVRFWEFSSPVDARRAELRVKDCGHTPRLCPRCTPKPKNLPTSEPPMADRISQRKPRPVREVRPGHEEV